MNTLKNAAKALLVIAATKGMEYLTHQKQTDVIRVRPLQKTSKSDKYYIPNDETCLFLEPISGEFIERSFKEVIEAEYHLNRNFVLRGYTDVDEFHDFLGITRMPYEKGKELGWSMYMGEAYYGYDWIDFYHEEINGADGRRYFVIKMPFPPTKDYMGPDED